jgi:hypothetical protein
MRINIISGHIDGDHCIRLWPQCHSPYRFDPGPQGPRDQKQVIEVMTYIRPSNCSSIYRPGALAQ